MRRRFSARGLEAGLLVAAGLLAVLGGWLAWGGERWLAGENPLAGLPAPLLPFLLAAGLWFALHFLLRVLNMRAEPLVLPLTATLFAIGLTLIFRLRGADGAWQQVTRGLLPGLLVVAGLVWQPRAVEWLRRHALWVSAAGLLLAVATAAFGVQDETGARLGLKLGPLPSIQTSEWIKLTLLIFLAWFVDREGEEVEGRSRILLGRLRLPTPRYFLPGAVFVGVAVLSLVAMSDYGAVLILGMLFIAMLYAGFQSRLFATIALIGAGFAALAVIGLSFTWQVPDVIQYRWAAFLNPWSTAEIVINGQPTGVTVAEGPGYQIQQAVYAIASGGLSGSGLGFGHPEFIPLSASDFIFAALLEELGALVGMAVLAIYGILIVRIIRAAVLLPPEQVFERLLLIGIGVHFFTQVFIMVGGTLNFFPLTGVTVPFLSLGGSALLTNLTELGLVLAVTRRRERSAV